MTCIVALRSKKGKLIFAGERREVADNHYSSVVIPKIVKRGGVMLGAAGDAFLGHVITTDLPIPKPLPGDGPHEYMTKRMLPCIMDYLRKNHIVSRDANTLIGKDDQHDYIGSMLIGAMGTVYQFEITVDSMQFIPVMVPAAVGSGGSYALGSLVTTTKMKLTTQAKIKLAMEAAAALDPYCNNIIDILSED